MYGKIDKHDKHMINLNKGKFQWLERGKNVWVQKASKNPDDVFLEAKVVDFSEDSEKVKVELIDNHVQLVTTLENCFKLTYGASDVSDMVDLQELNQPQLLFNIRRRYFNDVIFTYCGPTLLIINPYTKVDRLFHESLMQDYQTLVFSQTLEYKSQAPHIYGLAGFCLWQLFDNCRNQSIVISGESGAGKTENTKYCLNFLASLGRSMKELSIKKGSSFGPRNLDKVFKKISSKLTGIEDRILGCNEILEAFGNAKTIRNDNSSRFGKLIILIYGQTQVEIKSAFITNYLLEKSRIVSLSEGERNYHIFYYFCKGATEEERKRFRLTEPPTGYYFLNQSSVYEINTAPGKSDEDMFNIIKTEFALYLTNEEIDCVLCIVSAVLNLGNVKFSVKENQKRQEVIVIEKQNFLINAAELINVKPEQLSHALSYKTRNLAGSLVHSPLRLEEALALRDSFAKNLYEKLFNYLIYKLNDKIQLEKMDMDDLSQNRATRKSIGILDIFGFEILKRNSLEQFFINFANEKLQQLYVSYIFKEEENEFLKQGLKEFAYEFDFEDNKPIIDLIENYPLGILHLISESSELSKPDSSLPQTIVKNHPKTEIVFVPKSKPEFFQVNHSCSPVEYNVMGFTAKNKDEFPTQMLQIVSKIQNKVMHSIINYDNEKPDVNSKVSRTSRKFLGTKFLQQMNRLVEELHSCDCHFVRCIKPNEMKKPHMFNSASVLQSLRNLGVLDSIRIRKLGYVYRRPFHEFYKKFYQIKSYNFNYANEVEGKTEDDFKELSKKFVMDYARKQYEENHILIGKQKILIKEASLNVLEALAKQKRRLRISVANRIKTAFKKGKFRQKVNLFFNALSLFKMKVNQFRDAITEKIRLKRIVKIQRKCKQYLIDTRFKKIRQQATKSAFIIGKTWKMILQRRKYLKMREQAIHVQATIRMYLTKVKFYKQKLGKVLMLELFEKTWNKIRTQSAIEIQRYARGWLTRRRCKKEIEDIQRRKKEAIMKLRVIRIQKWWRYKMFRRAMSKYINAVQIIQANWRRTLLQRTYKLVLKSTLIIQKAVKKHLNKRYYCGMHWNKTLNNFENLQINRLKELSNLQQNMKQFKELKKHLEETSNRAQVASPAETCFKFAGSTSAYANFMNQDKSVSSAAKTFPLGMSTQSLIYSNASSSAPFNVPLNQTDKNDFQCYIVDLDLVSDVSQYYDEWTVGYKAILNDMSQKGELPIRIDMSENFTLVTSQKGRIYSFGQIEPFDKLFSVMDITDPYRIVCSEFNGYVLTTDRKMFVWGDNYDGEMMNGDQATYKGVTENIYLPLERITDFQLRGNNYKYLIANNRVYQYMHSQQAPTGLNKQFKLRLQLQFPEKIEVKSVVASKHFVHFLSINGCIYSKGNNNRGQLGLGHLNKVDGRPELNTYLKNNKEIVDCVSVGFKHTVCRTRLGYGYAWGDNSFKQVGGAELFYSQPRLVDIDKPTSKCLQFVAGFRCSVILLENMKMYGWGTNSSLSLVTNPLKIDYEKMFSVGNSSYSNDLMPVKLSCTWSNGISIVYINAIHLNKCRKSPTTTRDLITKTVKQFSKQWLPNAIYPPYNENAETHLNISDLKKFKFKPYELRQSQQPPKSVPTNSVQDMELLVELRRNSSTFSHSAKEKFQDILSVLLKKDVSQWTDDDRIMYDYLQNPKIQHLLKKL